MRTTINKTQLVVMVSVIAGLVGLVIYNSITYGTYSSPW